MFGDDIDPNVVGEIMSATDTDGDGTVDLPEFQKIMRKGAQMLGGISKVRVPKALRAASNLEPAPGCSLGPCMLPAGRPCRQQAAGMAPGRSMVALALALTLVLTPSTPQPLNPSHPPSHPPTPSPLTSHLSPLTSHLSPSPSP